MKIKLLCGVLAIAGISILNSCKDDEPPVAGISFESEEQEVTESDGTLASFNPDDVSSGEGRVIPVNLVFDRALAGDVVLEFDIDGSARKTSNSTESKDFEIDAEGTNLTVDGTKITLPKGATEASFSVRIYEDFLFEFDQDSPVNDDDIPYETIELTLTSVTSGPGKLGEKLTHTIKILEDDSYVFLSWNPGDQTGTVGDVDMDMFIYLNNELAGSSAYTNDDFENEFIVIPGGLPDADMGMSYVYHSGTSNDVDFSVEIANFGGNLTKSSGSSAKVYTFAATYGTVNKNPYVDVEHPGAVIEQTMTKSGLNYTAVTNITVPGSGSRVGEKSENPRAQKFSLLRSNLSTAKPHVIKTLKR